MAPKKDRGRFTLRLNEKDPAHAEVIRLLEQQDPHSKGRFIVNAVLHYVHCSETPDISARQTLDRTMIETIVLDILCQQKECVESSAEAVRPLMKQEELVQENTALLPEPTTNREKQPDADENVRNIIKGTLSAFRVNS
ncbi:hypothetical protein DS742_18170 [Lacrimispora amygdalina]|uniref:Plasmid segregation centromere-binding protein ParR n=1 Tax=Lacrimispora amygdalina TaxID=253257 RepID=A0A3E2N9B9_9FIRM|nr:hypothetical protein [Clostridium indicum]RFZ77481.1 hypothetical protein DS742_18170 [Clostridium indicum]